MGGFHHYMNINLTWGKTPGLLLTLQPPSRGEQNSKVAKAEGEMEPSSPSSYTQEGNTEASIRSQYLAHSWQNPHIFKEY